MAYPYTKARRHGGSQGRINRIVMHSTVTPCEPGWARKVAGWFHTWTKAASAHYVVDPREIIKCLPDGTVGYHAPPNTGSLGIEQCDWSRGNQWTDANHKAMLRLSARLGAVLAKRHDVPLTWLSPAELQAGQRGFTSHLNVGRAWRQTTHVDPGNFPVGVYMRLVREEYAKLTGEKPAEEPAETPVEAERAPEFPLPKGHYFGPPPGAESHGGGRDGHPGLEKWQRRMRERGWTAIGIPDGLYGPKTRRVTRQFQDQKGLTVDGLIGPKTWRAAWSAPIT